MEFIRAGKNRAINTAEIEVVYYSQSSPLGQWWITAKTRSGNEYYLEALPTEQEAQLHLLFNFLKDPTINEIERIQEGQS